MIDGCDAFVTDYAWEVIVEYATELLEKSEVSIIALLTVDAISMEH